MHESGTVKRKLKLFMHKTLYFLLLVCKRANVIKTAVLR